MPKAEEAPVTTQKQSSYEYTITLGPPVRMRKQIYFSPKEIRHLAIAALLVMGVGLSYGISGFAQMNSTIMLVVFTVILAVSFFVHEIAHKITAQRRGLWAEFRLTMWGALLTLIFMVLPVIFKIISPGAVMIAGPAQRDEIAKISIAGPITNIALALILLSVAFVPSTYSFIFFLGAFLNAWIALFNLIPIGILDGFKVFSWDKKSWALAFTTSLALTAVSSMFV